MNFILASVKKDLIAFPSDYVYKKLSNPYFQDLIYFSRKNNFLPEVMVYMNGDSLFVKNRGAYLEIANEIEEIVFVNVVILGSIHAVLVEKLKEEKLLCVRDIQKLAKNDFRKEAEYRWEVYRINRNLSDDEIERFRDKVLKFFREVNSLNSSHILESFNFLVEKKIVEFNVIIPRHSGEFERKYSDFLQKISQEFRILESVNGRKY